MERGTSPSPSKLDLSVAHVFPVRHNWVAIRHPFYRSSLSPQPPSDLGPQPIPVRQNLLVTDPLNFLAGRRRAVSLPGGLEKT